LFANQKNLKKSDLLKYAKQLKLDVSKFKQALDKGTYKKYVDADFAEARKIRVEGTPTFYVNGYEPPGGASFDNVKAMIARIEAGQPAIAPPAPKKPKVVKPVKIDIGKAIQFGPAKAKVTIVSFSDFECPYCSQGATILKQVLKAYKGKVRFVFKNMPLSFHPNAHLAAQAALAAHAQGKFWAFHDKLFGDQDNMKKADLLKYAKQLKLDMAKFKQALKKGIYKAQVDKELAQAQQVGVDGTPTCYINGYKVEGAQPFSRFKAVIDALLAGKPFPAEADDSSGSDDSGDSGDGDDTQQEPPKPKGPVAINLKGAPSVGPASSKVTVVEFSDFECPYCGEGAKLLNRLKKALGTKVRFVFKHLPLTFHPNAHLAAQASMAAHAQGKFWAYHDKLFANQDNLKKADLLKYAKQLKLDVAKFKQALDKGTYKKYVDADFAEARKIRVGGTPTFYVNGVELTDTPSFEAFKAMLEKALKAKPKPRPRPRAKVPAKRRPAPPRAR
jgi:protein-disulfide isomerase